MTGLTLAVMMVGVGIGGGQAVEVSLVVVPQTAVVQTVRVDPETDINTTMMDDDPVVEGDQETLEAAPTAQVVEEEEVPPLVKVTTVDEGLVDAPSWPTSWIGW